LPWPVLTHKASGAKPRSTASNRRCSRAQLRVLPRHWQDSGGTTAEPPPPFQAIAAAHINRYGLPVVSGKPRKDWRVFERGRFTVFDTNNERRHPQTSTSLARFVDRAGAAVDRNDASLGVRVLENGTSSLSTKSREVARSTCAQSPTASPGVWGGDRRTVPLRGRRRERRNSFSNLERTQG